MHFSAGEFGNISKNRFFNGELNGIYFKTVELVK